MKKILLFLLLPIFGFSQEFHVGAETGFLSYHVDSTSYRVGPQAGVTGLVYIPDQQWFLEGGAMYASYSFEGKQRFARMYGVVGIKDESVSRLFAGVGMSFWTNFQRLSAFGVMFKVGVVPYRKERISVKVNGEFGGTFSKLVSNLESGFVGGGSVQVTYRLWTE